MEDRETKIKTILFVALVWLIAIAFAFVVFMKIKLLNS